MATGRERETRGFTNPAAPEGMESANGMTGDTSFANSGPGDPDSTFPPAGPTDRAEPGTDNYRQATAGDGGDSSSTTGGITTPPPGGDDTAPPPVNAGGDNSTGDPTSGGNGDSNGSGGDSADSGSPIDGVGLGNIDLGGLIPDAVNDTQALVNDTVTSTQAGSAGLVSDVGGGVDRLVDNALDNLGLGNSPVGNLVDSLTGGNGLDVGNVVGSIVGPGSALDLGILPDGNGGLLQPVSDLTGGLTDGILGSPNGDGAILDLGIVGDGSPAVTNLLDNAGGNLLGSLGLGQILGVTGPQSEDGDPAASASVGQAQGSSGPLVTTQVFGNDETSPTNNLINLGAGENGEQSSIAADILGGGADNTNPAIDANAVDVGPGGQQLADASILTSPDQFAFQTLDGAGTDALAGILGTAGGTGPSLVPASLPVLDLGADPIIDLDLSGDANAGNDANPLQAVLHGQLLGSV